jgi:hypothetical protein
MHSIVIVRLNDDDDSTLVALLSEIELYFEASVNLVTAINLSSWADTLAAREDLPGLVASLIRASCPTLDSYHFPTGDSSQTHGFDGIAEVREASVFVPEGRSIWEFGAGKGYASKATSDYKNRTKELSLAQRQQMSFVFVTPRTWHKGREKWKEDHSSDGWKRVEVLDANSLELWLSEHPAVAIALAVNLGLMPPSGVRTIERFWEEYRTGFTPPLAPELLLTGRGDRAKLLCDALIAGIPGLDRWRAETPQEAAGFLAAAAIKAEPDVRRFLISKMLVIDMEDAARRMPTSSRSVLVLLPSASKVGPALARSNQVILALGSSDRSNANVLDRMNTREFATGLEAMDLTVEEAFRTASICGRSITVLSRLRPGGSNPPPVWHDCRELVPIMLAGAWDATNEYDCALIAELCGKNYEQVDADARRIGTLEAPPLELTGSVWALRSAQDAFTVLGRMVDTATQQRFRQACIKVFSERDLTLDIPENERPTIPTRGADFKHSEWLRRGLSTSLLLISGLHEAADFRTTHSTPQHYIDEIVAAIPGLAQNVEVLISLKSLFPTLAEAAPVPLVSALEHVLEGESEAWGTALFRDRKDQSFLAPFSPHTYILWGLEVTAWSPLYLLRTASLLMKLAAHDSGGKTQNRPLHSLRNIFLAWRPHTYAPVEQRISVLRTIVQNYPEQGFQLAMSLLPQSHDHTSGTAKPQIRDFGDANSISINPAEIQLAFQSYGELTVELASTQVDRLGEVIECFPRLDQMSRAGILTALRTTAETASDEQRFDLWSKLSDFVQKHQQFESAAWALPAEQLKPIEDLCIQLAPADPVRRILWLFDTYVPRLGPSKRGNYIEEGNQERARALLDLFRREGIESVLELAGRAKLPQFVGLALADAVTDIGILEGAIFTSVGPDSDISPDFSAAVSGRAHELHGPAWDNWLGQLVRSLDKVPAVNLLLRWDDSRKTWDFVASLGEPIDTEYWMRKPAFKQASDDDLLFAISKYIQVRRFAACLDMVAYEEHRVSIETCFGILRGLMDEVNEQTWKLQHTAYAAVHMIESLQNREGVDRAQLAAVEYAYLPLLEHQGRPEALHDLMIESPKFFVSVICDVFVAKSAGRPEVITDERRIRARLGYQLLQSLDKVPGFASADHNLHELREWVSGVRQLAKENDRELITDQQIGHILAHAPSDPVDHAWPITEIRELIEELASTDIELGISIGRFNMRGFFRKNLYDGGQEERGLAAEYRQWASMLRRWPRTSVLLEQMAESWTQSAEQADTRAELDQLT